MSDLISRQAVQEANTLSIELKENPHQMWKRIQDLPSTEKTVAQERYEDLCEYFGDAKDILKNREDFKAWLDTAIQGWG